MKLYEINDLIEKTIAEGVDRETGEISEELSARLDELGIERIEKIRHVMLYLKGEEAEAAAIQSVIDGLKKRKQVHDAHASWLRQYLERNTSEGDDVNDPRGRVYWKQSPGRVELTGTIDEVDPLYVKVEVVRTLDKVNAKTALKKGPVKGLKLAKPKLFTIE